MQTGLIWAKYPLPVAIIGRRFISEAPPFLYALVIYHWCDKLAFAYQPKVWGAIGLGIGFGMQKVVSNLVSAIILLLDKSIKPGDVISVGETFGWITGLGARYVSVVTREGKEHLIPNEDLITGQVVNWSHSSDLVRLDIPFGVAYDSDPHLVREIAKSAVGDVKRIVKIPNPQCHIVGFGDSSVDLKLRFWIRDPSAGLTNVRGDAYLALWDALKENNIEIPFPRRDVTVLK